MNTHKIRLILFKEWLELRQERSLIATSIGLPLLFTFIPVLIMFIARFSPDDDTMQFMQFFTDIRFQGLDLMEFGQVIGGQAFNALVLMTPLFLPTTIAAYSIIGEKTRRTLEPLLATPITTLELLVGKSLTALIPTIIMSYFSGLVFIAGIALTALSPRVFELVINPGWLILWLLCSPLLGMISIAVSVLISSRVNDPRTAQQISGFLVLPVMMLAMAQLFGVVLLTPASGFLITAILAVITAGAIWLSVRLFRRETILTRWT